MALSANFRLELDEGLIRRWHDEYVRDVAYYREHDELLPDHPDRGYATGVPLSWEEYAAEMFASILAEMQPPLGASLERTDEPG